MATGAPNFEKLQTVKVFSATMARDREALGDRVTTWIRSNPELAIQSTVVVQSSDQGFHCLSIVVFCGAANAR
jgi:hypothetical protein